MAGERTPTGEQETVTQRLYASHWLGSPSHASEDCQPYLYAATLLPLGVTIRCSVLGCEGTWTLTETHDLTSLIPVAPPAPGGPDGT